MAHYHKRRNEERWVAMQGMHMHKEREQTQSKTTARRSEHAANGTHTTNKWKLNLKLISVHWARNSNDNKFLMCPKCVNHATNEPYNTERVQIESYLFFSHTKVSMTRAGSNKLLKEAARELGCMPVYYSEILMFSPNLSKTVSNKE
jgi:hypothetical protein